MERLPATTVLLEWADDYAREGLPIIPLRGKVPAVTNWQRFVPTPVSVRFWFGTKRCNVGLRTGESNYVVIDTDTPEAEEWVVSHCAESPMQSLSGSGSRHRYYRCPPREEIRNHQGLNGIRGLDVRGHGGYIVLPPSVHPETGKVYQWLTDFSQPEGLPAFSPSWVYERRQRVKTAVADVFDPDGLLVRAKLYLGKIEPAVSGQGGHVKTLTTALKLARLVGRNPDLLWLLLVEYNARCLPPWSESELRHKWSEALRLSQ
jgi:hypothetical protein